MKSIQQVLPTIHPRTQWILNETRACGSFSSYSDEQYTELVLRLADHYDAMHGGRRVEPSDPAAPLRPVVVIPGG